MSVLDPEQRAFYERELAWARDNRFRLRESITLFEGGLMHTSQATTGLPMRDTTVATVAIYKSQLSQIDELIPRLEAELA